MGYHDPRNPYRSTAPVPPEMTWAINLSGDVVLGLNGRLYPAPTGPRQRARLSQPRCQYRCWVESLGYVRQCQCRAGHRGSHTYEAAIHDPFGRGVALGL